METIAETFRASDHLAVLKRFKVKDEDFLVASFNVLFEKWLKMNVHAKNRETGIVTEYGGHIGQYFRHLADMNPVDRKKDIFSIIRALLVLHKVDILCLQEFDNNDVPALREILREIGNYGLILPSDFQGYVAETEDKRTAEGNNDLQLIIHRSSIDFEKELSTLAYYEADKPSKRILTSTFYIHGAYFILVGTHVAFGKMTILFEKLTRTKKGTAAHIPIIIVGDMNQEERPEGLEGSPGDANLLALVGKTLQPAKFSHIDTKGVYRLYDHIWTI